MKSLLTILLLLNSFFVVAQKGSKREIKAIANTILLEQTVFGSKDSATLEGLFAKNATYAHSSGKVETRNEAISNIVRNKSVYIKKDTAANYEVKSFKDSTIVSHLFIATETKPDGTQSALRLRLDLVWIKEKKNWKLYRRKATRI